MAKVNYLKSFNDYDMAVKPHGTITNDELKRAAVALRQKQNMEVDAKTLQERKERALSLKISKLMPIIKSAEQAVNNRIKMLDGINVKVKDFRLSTLLSVDSLKNNSTGVMTKLNFNMAAGNSATPSTVNLNINVNKFLNYSASEAYSVLTTALYKSVLGRDMGRIAGLENEAGLLASGKRANARSNIKDTFEYTLAKYKLETYIEDFIKERSSLYTTNVSKKEILHTLLKESLSNEMIIDIANNEFDLSKLDTDIVLIGNFEKIQKEAPKEENEAASNAPRRDLVIDENKKGRAQKLLEGKDAKARSAFVNEGMLAEQNLRNSFAAVKSAFTPYGLNRSSENMKNLETFCKDFSSSYMKAQGLTPIEIRFINDPKNPAIGEYFDAGSTQYIEVNLTKVKDIVDLTSTLAHELTHATESSINKANGNFNAHGGGIHDSISTDISNSGLTGDAYKLLKDLNYACYKVDPCEQRARDGELIGVDFVAKLAGSEFSAEINKYHRTNNSYQAKVDSIKANLSNSIAEYESRLSSLNISPSSKGYSMIMSKLEYLKNQVTLQKLNSGNGKVQQNKAGAISDKQLADLGIAMA